MTPKPTSLTFVHAHRDMLICFAAGNEGSDRDGNGRVDPNSVTPPGTAKNCTTVGACENNRPNQAMTYGEAWPDDFPPLPSTPIVWPTTSEGMVAFSSRGPTNDERIKPDVVALVDRSFCQRAPAPREIEGMAALERPALHVRRRHQHGHASGGRCVAVVRAFLRKSQGLKSPSAALLKALIINGARSLAGQYQPSEAGSVANNSQGFGRVDVQAVVGPHAANETLLFFDEKKKLDAGDREDRTVTIPAGNSRLKVTLVWTDPPGEGLQSDLDLVVVANKQERHGNMPAGSKDFDRKNNVEQVIFENLPPGEAVISVIAHSIAVAPQNYALVIRVS